MKRKLLTAFLKYFEWVKGTYPDIKKPKEVFEPQIKMITKAFNITKITSQKHLIAIDVQYDNIRVKCGRWYDLGTYTCCITLASDGSIGVRFYEQIHDIFGREIEKSASHPHIQNGKACWGSFKTPIWNAFYALNYMGALAQIKAYLGAYNGRSTYIAAPYYQRDILLPSEDQRAKVFQSRWTPRVLVKHIKAFKEDENVIKMYTDRPTEALGMNTFLGIFYERGYRNGVLIKHVYDFFDGQVPVYSCYLIVKEFWRNLPKTNSVDDGLYYYLDKAKSERTGCTEDKVDYYLDIIKLIRKTKSALRQSKYIRNGNFWSDKLGISSYHNVLRLNTDIKDKYQDIINQLSFIVININSTSIFTPEDTAIVKLTDKIIDKKAYLAYFYGETEDKSGIFDWSHIKALTLDEVCEKLEPICSQLIDVQILMRKYQLRKLERHFNQLFMEVRNETNSITPGPKPHQLSFDSI